MVRPKKEPEADRERAVDASRVGFEDDGNWRVGWYEGNNPYRIHTLLPEELATISIPSLFDGATRDLLADRFGLTEAQVHELARRVEAALDPQLTPLSLAVAERDGTRRGTEAIEQGFRALADAQDRLMDAVEVLMRLRAKDEESEASEAFGLVRDTLDRCQANVVEMLEVLDGTFRHKDLLYLPDVSDRRQVGAARRTLILWAVIDFWAWAGRKVSFTTRTIPVDRSGKYRSGPLLELCLEILRIAGRTDHPVSQQTIVDAIRAWKAR